MYICYVDEAGCTGELDGPGSAIQPVFALVGVFLPAGRLQSLTRGWIQVKQQYFPKRLPAGASIHDWMVVEIKGSDIRNMARGAARNERRFAHQFINSALDLLERHGACMTARVFVKPIGGLFDGKAVYTSSVQTVFSVFQEMLIQRDDHGIVIADSRNKGKNTNVAHSIFTQRYAARGDPYDHIVEMPTFGHSDNHAGLQLADIACSAVIFPLVAQRCAAHHLTNQIHCSAHYLKIGERFGKRVQDLQFRTNQNGYWIGGISLTDRMSHLAVTSVFC